MNEERVKQIELLKTIEQMEFLEELTSVAVSARYEDIELTDPSEIYTKSVVEEYMQKALPIIEVKSFCTKLGEEKK